MVINTAALELILKDLKSIIEKTKLHYSSLQASSKHNLK